MKPAAFEYARASSVAEAVAMLTAGDESARLLAGGQSLGPMLNLRLARPAKLIDIKRVPSLRAVTADLGVMRIGACRSHAEIEDGAVEDITQGMLLMVAHGIAYRAVRNRGTIGGSLAHADPAADWVSALTALGAIVIVHGPDGERRVAVGSLIAGAYATVLRPAEIITAVEVPRLHAGARWGYYKICRKTGEFANAIGAAVIDEARGIARVVCGATEGAPLVLDAASAQLRGSGTEAAASVVADEIADRMGGTDDVTRRLHVVAVRRALAQLGTSSMAAAA